MVMKYLEQNVNNNHVPLKLLWYTYYNDALIFYYYDI